GITLDGSGTLATAQITTLSRGALTLAGNGFFDFSALASAANSSISLQGAQLLVPNLAVIDGSSLSVSGGSQLALPLGTSYSNTTGENDETRTLQAGGLGSLLDLRNVTLISNGLNYDTHLKIKATGGAHVDLSGAAEITDPVSGDTRFRDVNVTADGTGS